MSQAPLPSLVASMCPIEVYHMRVTTTAVPPSDKMQHRAAGSSPAAAPAVQRAHLSGLGCAAGPSPQRPAAVPRLNLQMQQVTRTGAPPVQDPILEVSGSPPGPPPVPHPNVHALAQQHEVPAGLRHFLRHQLQDPLIHPHHQDRTPPPPQATVESRRSAFVSPGGTGNGGGGSGGGGGGGGDSSGGGGGGGGQRPPLCALINTVGPAPILALESRAKAKPDPLRPKIVPPLNLDSTLSADTTHSAHGMLPPGVIQPLPRPPVLIPQVAPQKAPAGRGARPLLPLHRPIGILTFGVTTPDSRRPAIVPKLNIPPGMPFT